MPNSESSIHFQSPDIKHIDILERSDVDLTLLEPNSLKSKLQDKIMSISKNKQFDNHKCYGLINGVSQELPQYKNPIFCKSYHPEINQNGIWDAPCQLSSECPFYKANVNYPNDFGKCIKDTGICEMPQGIIPIGFKKYGRIEPDCYNCDTSLITNKCCGIQDKNIKKGLSKALSPDYIFMNDEAYRKQYDTNLQNLGLLVNPSI